MLIIERAATDASFDVGKLQALLEMRDRWSKEEARKAFVVALTDFKADPPDILKTKHVSFASAGGRTSYNHAALGDASALIGAGLANHGLSHRWNVEQTPEGRIAVTCILTHIMGHSESVRMESNSDQSGGKNNIQAIGSATSYLQRYTLFAAAGVIAKDQEDDDGSSTGHAPIKGPQPKNGTKAEAPPSDSTDDGSDTATFIPAATSTKPNKNGKPRWAVKSPEGTWYSTYNAEAGEIACSAKQLNKPVTIQYVTDGAFCNIVSAVLAE